MTQVPTTLASGERARFEVNDGAIVLVQGGPTWAKVVYVVSVAISALAVAFLVVALLSQTFRIYHALIVAPFLIVLLIVAAVARSISRNESRRAVSSVEVKEDRGDLIDVQVHLPNGWVTAAVARADLAAVTAPR